MAKLYQHKEDETYFTVRNIGGFVTRQIHPDGVAYLKYCGVQVGGEIPSTCMSELLSYGWLFTKDEMPFWGEVDWSPQWQSVHPKPLSALSKFRSVAEWGAPHYVTPPTSAVDVPENRADEVRIRIERRHQEMLQSIRADVASKRSAREISDQRARAEARRLKAAEKEEQRQRREAARARNEQLHVLRTQERREAAAKGAETRRRNAAQGTTGIAPRHLAQPVYTTPNPEAALVPGPLNSAALAVPLDEQGQALEHFAAPLGEHSLPEAPIYRLASSLPAWMRAGQPDAAPSSTSTAATTSRRWREMADPEAKWTLAMWIGFAVLLALASGAGDWLVRTILVAMVAFKLFGLIRQVNRILRKDHSHIVPWHPTSEKLRDNPNYRRDRKLVVTLLLIVFGIIGFITNETDFEWLGAAVIIPAIWTMCEFWRLRDV